MPEIEKYSGFLGTIKWVKTGETEFLDVTSGTSTGANLLKEAGPDFAKEEFMLWK